MKSMKVTLSALLLGLSLSAFAQDEDELLNDAAEDAAAEEVFVPTTPTDKKFFQRVQLGYTGTITKYTNFGESPDYNNYFLHGISVGWMGDLRIARKIGLFLELGGTLTYHTGVSKGERFNVHHDESYNYRVNAFSFTIPVNISKQFKEVFGVEDLTLAPFVGVYARFNLMAKRTANAKNLIDGTEKSYTASLMEEDPGPDYGESTAYMRCFNRGEKLHTGRLLQAGAQAGVNAFYKRYSFGIAYMHDLTPFAKDVNPAGVERIPRSVGGYTVSQGNGADMEISTRHNFMLTVGYVF